MKILSFNSILGCLLVLMLAHPAAAKSRDLYRYKNAEGNTVVDYHVPVEYAGAGYEVLNDEGMVIEVVPRELTEEERKAADAASTLQDEAEAEQQRLRDWDESLMLRYSTVADIEAARERALGNLRIRLSILKGNRRSLKQKVENFQAQAADLERAGMEVDVARLRTIEDLQGEIAATERSIGDREHEIEDLAMLFQEDIERFEMLLEVVEMRRTMHSSQKKKTRRNR